MTTALTAPQMTLNSIMEHHPELRNNRLDEIGRCIGGHTVYDWQVALQPSAYVVTLFEDSDETRDIFVGYHKLVEKSSQFLREQMEMFHHVELTLVRQTLCYDSSQHEGQETILWPWDIYRELTPKQFQVCCEAGFPIHAAEFLRLLID